MRHFIAYSLIFFWSLVIRPVLLYYKKKFPIIHNQMLVQPAKELHYLLSG